jgi:hypothetical protein
MAVASSAQHLGSEPSAPSHKWFIALAVMLGTVLEVLDTSIINVALPHFRAHSRPASTRLHGW